MKQGHGCHLMISAVLLFTGLTSVPVALAKIEPLLETRFPDPVTHFNSAHSTPDGPQGAPLRKIRVRITTATPELKIRGFDLKWSSGRKLVHREDKLSEWKVACTPGRIQVEALASDAKVREIRAQEPVEIVTPAGFLSLNGAPYRETIRIYSDDKGCEVINEVDVDEYLDGLVNMEFSSRWNENAVKAQVVAARTYAFYQMIDSRKRGRHFDVESSVKDQVYSGASSEDALASRIVDQTKGLVLMVNRATGKLPEKWEPLKAFYHSSCGGLTELPNRVWGESQPGFYQRVKCPYCKDSPSYGWQLDLSSNEVLALARHGMKRLGKPPGFTRDSERAMTLGTLARIRTEKLESGRVGQVVMEFVDAEASSKWVSVSVPAPLFRDWIGPARLKSTSFEITVAPSSQSWRLVGRGNGHGVGMCQWGAKKLGEKGQTMASILKLYYPDAVLKKLW